MSNYIIDIHKDNTYAIINTSRGTIVFKDNCDYSMKDDITKEQKNSILVYYMNQFAKNKKLGILMKDAVPIDYYEDYLAKIRSEVEKNTDLAEISEVEMHAVEKMDLEFFDFFWKQNPLKVKHRDVCVFVDPFQDNAFKIIETVSNNTRFHLCFVLDLARCIHEESFMRIMNLIDMATECRLVYTVMINVSEELTDKLKDVYYLLFKEGAYRTKINEIWINCIDGTYKYGDCPNDLTVKTNIQCYEKVMALISENPELMTMKIIGDDYLKRIQNVFEERVPLRPIQAFVRKNMVQVIMENHLCNCKIYAKNVRPCIDCEKYELCGGLCDGENRCIDFEGVMNSAYRMFRFVKGEKL